MSGRLALIAAMTIASVGLPGILGWGQQPKSQARMAVELDASGAKLFKDHCASCHGVSGKGNGRVASSLTPRPADLTVLTRNAGGKFPRQLVERMIRGEAPTDAHGTKEMPVWGPILLLSTSPSLSEHEVRITKLVDYVESLQVNTQTARPLSEDRKK